MQLSLSPQSVYYLLLGWKTAGWIGGVGGYKNNGFWDVIKMW
jgi:hypothetical protein